MARAFAEAGATWVHVVDLDAAFGDGSNRPLIRELAGEVPIRVQTGGGLRTEADLEEVLESGVARAVIGTAALEQPELVRRAVERWGAERIAVGLDARGRRPAARGWTEESGSDLFDVARSLVDLGVRTLIYTDIERDGMLQGPNLVMAAALANFCGAEVIVSGGISSLEDVVEVNRERRMGIRLCGVIVGKAYYEGRLDLAEAVRRVEG
jgi:phosphoribosylformimino-5-aminoimidazole carboxamide ribotide isomerase